ncbi:MAG: hypothetical protein QN189_05485 [Armatimonadota bacterium]|nr:hypothetical protein [Armatimonadota bacterium]
MIVVYPRASLSGREFSHEAIPVEGLGGHQDPLAAPRPLISRSVRVQLDAVAVGIRKVYRLTHPVVGGAIDGPPPPDKPYSGAC